MRMPEATAAVNASMKANRPGRCPSPCCTRGTLLFASSNFNSEAAMLLFCAKTVHTVTAAVRPFVCVRLSVRRQGAL